MSGARNLPFGMMLWLVSCGAVPGIRAAHTNSMVVRRTVWSSKSLPSYPVAVVPGGPGRHLTDQVRRHVGVGHRAQLPTGRRRRRYSARSVYVRAVFAEPHRFQPRYFGAQRSTTESNGQARSSVSYISATIPRSSPATSAGSSPASAACRRDIGAPSWPGEQRDGRSRLRRVQRQLRAVGQQAQAVEEDEVEERFPGLGVGEQRASRRTRLGGNLRRAGAAVAKPTEQHLDGGGRYGG